MSESAAKNGVTKKPRRFSIVGGILLCAVIMAAGAGAGWYFTDLQHLAAPTSPPAEGGDPQAKILAEIPTGDLLVPSQPADSTNLEPVSPVQGESAAPPQAPMQDARQNASELRELLEEAYDAQSVADQLWRGDIQLLEGSFSEAIRSYRAAQLQSESQVPQIIYRLAVCSELLGEFDGARDLYQGLLSDSTSPEFRDLGMLGIARIFRSQGNPRQSIDVLYRRFLTLDRREHPAIAAELLHELSQSLSALRRRRNDPRTLLMPGTLTVVDARPDGSRLLTLMQKVGKPEPVELTIPAGITVSQKIDDDPDGTYLRARWPAVSASRMLTALATAGGMSVRFGPDVLDRLFGRQIAIELNDASLGLVLDAALAPLDLSWSIEGTEIVVEPLDTTALDAWYARLRRVAMVAVSEFPDHDLAPATYSSLGFAAAETGRIVESLRINEQILVLYPRSQYRWEAYFNQAKCSLAIGEREAALSAFHNAIDLSVGNANDAVAYLFLGRLHLENGESRQAILPLMRSVATAEGTVLEGVAALTLSSAYLMNGNPRGANSVLMEHRETLVEPLLRDTAGFLSSYVHYRAGVTEKQKMIAARSLVDAIAHFRPDNAFGDYWWLLKGQACDELGLRDEAILTFESSLVETQPFPLRSQVILQLARLLALEGRADDAKRVWQMLSQVAESDVRTNARLSLARQNFYDGNTDEAIALCDELIREDDDDALRAEVFKLLGQVYLSRDDHLAAVRCFAGLLPGPQAAPETP